MWKFNDKVWTYWLVTDALLILDVFGWAYGLIAASVLTAIQVIHLGSILAALPLFLSKFELPTFCY